MSVEVGGGSAGEDRMVQALRDAGQHVFAHLYESYAAPLFDYCASILGAEVAATDAVQDSLVAVNARIGPLPEPGRLRVALYSEARRQCLARRPRRGAGGARSAGAGPPAGPVRPQAAATDTAAMPGGADAPAAAGVPGGADAPRAAGVPGGMDNATIATHALRSLSGPDSEVLNLAFRHGIEGADLGAVLGVPPRRARSVLSAAGARFREAAADVAARRDGVAAGPVPGPEMLAAIPLATPPFTLGLRMTRTALALGSYRRVAPRPAGVPGEDPIPARPAPRRGLPRAMAVSTLGFVIIAVPGALLYDFLWAPAGRIPAAAQMAGAQNPAAGGSSLSTAFDPGGSVRQHRQGPFRGVLGPPPLGVLPAPSPQQSGAAPTPGLPQTTSPGPVPSHSTTPPPTTPPPTTPPSTTPPPTTPPPTTPPPTTPPPTTPPPTTPPPTTPPPTPTPTG